MNKKSNLVSVILSAVAFVLFVVSFVLTKTVDISKEVVTTEQTTILYVGMIVSLLGLILNLVNEHKFLKLIPIITFAVFALYVANYADSNYMATIYGENGAFFNYPVLNFIAIILFVVSAIFMVKDEYKWAKVTFAVTSIFLATIITTQTMSYFFLFDIDGAAYLSLIFIAAAVMIFTPAVVGLCAFLPEVEAQAEEEKVEEVKEEETTEEVADEEDAKAKEKAEIDEEVRQDVEAKFAEAERKRQEQEESDSEVKLDFGDNNN